MRTPRARRFNLVGASAGTRRESSLRRWRLPARPSRSMGGAKGGAKGGGTPDHPMVSQGVPPSRRLNRSARSRSRNLSVPHSRGSRKCQSWNFPSSSTRMKTNFDEEDLTVPSSVDAGGLLVRGGGPSKDLGFPAGVEDQGASMSRGEGDGVPSGAGAIHAHRIGGKTFICQRASSATTIRPSLPMEGEQGRAAFHDSIPASGRSGDRTPGPLSCSRLVLPQGRRFGPNSPQPLRGRFTSPDATPPAPPPGASNRYRDRKKAHLP